MNYITVKEFSLLVGLSKRTIEYKLAQFKKQRKFKRKNKGYFFTINEVKKLLKLMDLPIKLVDNFRKKMQKSA